MPTLEPPYSGPYQVLLRRDKTLQLFVRGKPITVSADRVKPADILNETNYGSTTFKLFVHGKPITVSAERIKPADILNETNYGSTTFNPSPSTIPATAPLATLPPPPDTQSTRSGDLICFPACFNT
jgi:hypothetical protein